jgi:V/A-type H+/Na+-transporting ATPase subunit I
MPVPMQRTRIFVLKQDQNEVVGLLQELGAVQLEQADRASFFREPTPPDYSTALADESFRLDGLATALPPVPVTEKVEVGNIDDILSKAKEVRIDEVVKRLKLELENVDLSLNRNNTYLRSLERITGFDADLASLSTQSVNAGFYSVEIGQFDDFVQSIKGLSKDALVGSYSSSKDTITALVILPKQMQEQVRPVFEKFRTTKLELPTGLGTPAEALKKLKEENSLLQERKNNIEKELLQISKKYYPRIVGLKEALNIEGQRIDVLARAGQSDSVFVIEGWVPKPRLPELEKRLAALTNGRAVIEGTKTKEIPPTLMQNSPRINYFEFFVRFFSLPQSEEIDPTWTLAIIFPIFFGMMLGDVGYGLVILLLAFWFARLGSGKANARWLPRSIRNFGRSLMPKRALGQLGRILIPSAIIGMIIGVLANAYFGFRLPPSHPYTPVFDLIRTPQIYLIVTLFVGLAHITLGYIYGILIAKRNGHMHLVYAKIGWLGFLWSGVAAVGIALTFVLPVHAAPIIFEYVALASMVVFGGIVFAFEKMRFLMEIPTLISHVVSYGRILGVLLASLLLGYIAASSISLSSPIFSLVMALIVLAMVTILNIVLGIFEPAIQGIRLHYVEFYSKFFEGNGKRFTPFAERRGYTKKQATT